MSSLWSSPLSWLDGYVGVARATKIGAPTAGEGGFQMLLRCAPPDMTLLQVPWYGKFPYPIGGVPFQPHPDSIPKRDAQFDACDESGGISPSREIH